MSKWPLVRLKDVLEYEQPIKYIVQSTEYNETFDTPVLTAGQSFILGHTNEKSNVFVSNLPVIIFDDFTTAIKYVDFPFKVKSSAIKILKAHKQASIKYLFYCMSRIKIDTELHKRYWISTYSNIQVPLPPLPIQQKVADILDRANALIEKRKTQIEKLDLLVKSQFIEMFGDPVTNPKGWEAKNIGDLTKVMTGATPNRSRSEYYANGRIPWIKTGEISKGYIFEAEEYIAGQALVETNCKILPVDTVMVAMYGVGKTRGESGILKIPAATNQACAAILPSVNFNTSYLHQYLQHQYETLRGLGRGAQQTNLNLDIVKKFPLTLPPLPLQNRFADFVRQADKSKFALQRSLKKLELAYKALLIEHFG